MFISKAQLLASGMFLCHFQILCGFRKSPWTELGRNQTKAPETRFLKCPCFSNTLQSSWLFLPVTLVSGTFHGGLFTPQTVRSSNREDLPPRPPNSPDEDAPLLTVLSLARDHF